jgi:hypothetical protein
MTLGSTQPLTEMSTRNLSGGKGRVACKAENLTAVCELIVQNTWEPQHLTTLWASTACYRDSFTFTGAMFLPIRSVGNTCVSNSLSERSKCAGLWGVNLPIIQNRGQRSSHFIISLHIRTCHSSAVSRCCVPGSNQGHVRSVVDKVALWADFLRVLRSPLPILIPPTATRSFITSWSGTVSQIVADVPPTSRN